MAVVQIWIVDVLVHQPSMAVRMRVRLAYWLAVMGMLVVRVMDVQMIMLHRLVHMAVLMPFGQM